MPQATPATRHREAVLSRTQTAPAVPPTLSLGQVLGMAEQIADSGLVPKALRGKPADLALVLDTGVGALVCEIDGVRYLPRGRAIEAAADPARTREELRGFAESHLRPVGRT